MTDITDQDRRVAHEWAASIDPEMDCWSASARAVARVILATVDAPTTLSEEMANITEHWEEWATDTITAALNAATDFAKQMEHDLTEALAKVEQAEDSAAEWQGIAQRDYARVELLGADLAEARAEVERLTAVAEDYARRATAALTERDEARAEVERITAERDNEKVTLVSRLVPAPRVITDADELDTLAEQTIVRDHYDGEALQKINGKWIAARIQQDDGFSSGNIATVTVLWEPEA